MTFLRDPAFSGRGNPDFRLVFFLPLAGRRIAASLAFLAKSAWIAVNCRFYPPMDKIQVLKSVRRNYINLRIF
jgi:hypothetical protein